MQTLIVEIESPSKAKELLYMLKTMSGVLKVTSIKKRKEMIEVLQEHEEMKTAILKRKNKAIAKYL